MLQFSKEQEIPYLIEHDDSLFDDQLKKICGTSFVHRYDSNNVRIRQVILVEAKKNSKKSSLIRQLISEGFYYNKVHYVRYGKSSSQGKDGITLFIDERVYEKMFQASILGVEVDECVTSKYESQRCLTLSTCTLIKEKLPYIVVVDEYTKILPNQEIRYVEEVEEEIVDKETKLPKKIKVRKVRDGIKNIKISPLDGGGCHDKRMSEIWSKYIGLKDYIAVAEQIRLPFFKGISAEVPFKEIFAEMGVTQITDVCGKVHNVADIDCIWNTSMWKGFGIFKKKYGIENAWDKYIEAITKYEYPIGISKYSHHINHLNLKTRMNYQYLQCLNLWNDKYIKAFEDKKLKDFDLMNTDNWGNMLKLGSYTTNLYEKIIKGDKFYTCKFFGIEDSDDDYISSAYLKAVLINDEMLKDPAIRRFIHCKLKKAITEAKIGKIYASGLYNTAVGDMIGYLEYIAKREVVGCLKAHEFYCGSLPNGDVLSFRSPLVCPSEVNKVSLISNEITDKWFKRFKEQDVVMLNMYDLSMPQQGGIKWCLSSLWETIR